MATWDAGLYLRFERERTRPAVDLVNGVGAVLPKRILDVGCGPGNSTEVICGRFPDAEVLGVDSSAEMIAAARARAWSGRVSFREFDAASPLAGLGVEFDLVFSNACMQWIGGHEELLRDWVSMLRPGGVLAVQMPMQGRSPVHQALRALAQEPQWRGRFEGIDRLNVLEPGEYFDIFTRLGMEFSIWSTTYYQRMESHAGILEWYSGTGLRPYLQALLEEEREGFEAALLERIREAFPVQADGSVLFPFDRLFMTATREK